MSASTISLTDEQTAVVCDIMEWFENDRHRKQILTVAGYAGVGKSTVVKAAIESLDLDPTRVGYVTFTGKAALVLQMKGNKAQTIHSLIYEPILVSFTHPVTKLKGTRVAGFKKREALTEFDLLVLDEVSMVSLKLLDDIRSFRVPMLALGDPAQLPPVMGVDNKLLTKPDAFLRQVHRQAADNPILWASMRIREGRGVPYGRHGENLIVVPRNQVTIEQKVWADQVICCTHRERKTINAEMRKYLGYEGLPKEGEKLICLKNNWDEVAFSRDMSIPLVNGLMVKVLRDVSHDLDVHDASRMVYLNLAMLGDPDAQYLSLESNLDYFEPIPGYEPATDGMHNAFDYGYAITCHKSQGSEWDNVVYLHDGFGDWVQQRQLLYTGCTRAAKNLILAM